MGNIIKLERTDLDEKTVQKLLRARTPFPRLHVHFMGINSPAPGTVLGNFYHKRGYRFLMVTGGLIETLALENVDGSQGLEIAHNVGKGKAILIPPGMAFAMHISKPTRITVYSSDDRNCQIPWPLLDGVGNPLNKVRPLQQIA